MSTRDINNFLSETQDDIARSAGYIDEARDLLEAALTEDTRSTRWGPITATAAGVAFIAASALWFAMMFPNEVGVTIEEDGSPLEVGSWLSASKNKRLELVFSDGSRVSLAANSEIRLQGLAEEGAHLLLERGSVNVSVVHRKETDWRLDAGPYHIRVTGTRFDTHWIPEKKAFSLSVREGSVMVDGPMLADGKRLTSGDNIHVSLFDKLVEVNKKDTYEKITARTSRNDARVGLTEPPATNIPATINEIPEESIPEVAMTRSHRRGGSRSAVKSLSWRVLAERGEYVEAVAQAERTGFQQIVATAALGDLMLLGDAARLADNPGRAVRVYKTVRSRFAGTSEAQRAAFTLGRIAFESRGRYREAARWFAACVRDDRHGSMAREAAGRLIESLDRAGDDQGARSAASAYLRQFANGPHAKLAKQILSETE